MHGSLRRCWKVRPPAPQGGDQLWLVYVRAPVRRMNIKHILQLSSGVGGAVTFFTNKEKLAEFRLKPIVSSQRSVLVKIKPFLAFFFFLTNMVKKIMEGGSILRRMILRSQRWPKLFRDGEGYLIFREQPASIPQDYPQRNNAVLPSCSISFKLMFKQLYLNDKALAFHPQDQEDRLQF